MVRQWRGGDSWDGGAAVAYGGALLALWALLLSLFLVTAAVFSCSGGASEDKNSAASHADTYGGAGCAAACGGGCGG